MRIDWGQAGAVILSGLVLVFVALVILIAIVTLMGYLMKRRSGEKDADKPSAPPAKGAAKPASPPAAQGGVTPETVAAISAAIAVVMGESAPGARYVIRDIRRARDTRSVWSLAGLQQNTRPF